MDAFKVIISMFLVLFYAGVTYQKPHNDDEILHETVDETDIFNNKTDTLTNITDEYNNTTNLTPKITYMIKQYNTSENILDKVPSTDVKMSEKITTTEASVTVTEPPVAVNTSCVTGWEMIGGCIKRKYCDYGTQAIDLTLYAKNGYHSVCTGEEMVCCPFQSQLPILPERKVDYDDFISDDDNDY